MLEGWAWREVGCYISFKLGFGLLTKPRPAQPWCCGECSDDGVGQCARRTGWHAGAAHGRSSPREAPIFFGWWAACFVNYADATHGVGRFAGGVHCARPLVWKMPHGGKKVNRTAVHSEKDIHNAITAE